MRNTVTRMQIPELITNSKIALSYVEIENLLGGLCNRIICFKYFNQYTDL